MNATITYTTASEVVPGDRLYTGNGRSVLVTEVDLRGGLVQLYGEDGTVRSRWFQEPVSLVAAFNALDALKEGTERARRAYASLKAAARLQCGRHTRRA